MAGVVFKPYHNSPGSQLLAVALIKMHHRLTAVCSPAVYVCVECFNDLKGEPHCAGGTVFH
jgi:hypothetical protein